MKRETTYRNYKLTVCNIDKTFSFKSDKVDLYLTIGIDETGCPVIGELDDELIDIRVAEDLYGIITRAERR